jgi:hypothetical protein
MILLFGGCWDSPNGEATGLQAYLGV